MYAQGSGEEAQWLRLHLGLPEEPSFIPRVYFELKTHYNLNSKGSNIVFWPSRAPELLCTYLHTDTHKTHTNTHMHARMYARN